MRRGRFITGGHSMLKNQSLQQTKDEPTWARGHERQLQVVAHDDLTSANRLNITILAYAKDKWKDKTQPLHEAITSGRCLRAGTCHHTKLLSLGRSGSSQCLKKLPNKRWAAASCPMKS